MNARRMEEKALIINVEITELECGGFQATSPELDEVCIVHEDVHTLIDDIPNVIRQIMKERFGSDAFVIQAGDGPGRHPLSAPWIAIPAHLAQARLADCA